MSALDLDALRARVEPRGARVVCLSFERFGEGSDKDGGWEKGGFFKGPMFAVDKKVYGELFGRKGFLNSFYGLGDMSADKVAASRARQVGGNFAGDGMQLGGQFVVAPPRGDAPAAVTLDHRQGLCAPRGRAAPRRARPTINTINPQPALIPPPPPATAMMKSPRRSRPRSTPRCAAERGKSRRRRTWPGARSRGCARARDPRGATLAGA